MDNLPTYILGSSKSRLFATLIGNQLILDIITFGQHGRLGDKVDKDLRLLSTERSNISVLQVGVVPGSLTTNIVDVLGEGGKLTIVDPIGFQLERARANITRHTRKNLVELPHIHFVNDVGERMAFSDDSYDAIILFFLLHELPIGIQREILERSIRMLKRNGLIIIGDFSRPNCALGRFLISTLAHLGQSFLLPFINTSIADLLPSGTGRIAKEEFFFFQTFQLVVISKVALQSSPVLDGSAWNPTPSYK